MVKQELLDEKLVLEQTSQYKLSIQVSLNGFSFCCLDDRTKRFVALKDYSFSNVSGSLDEMIFNLESIFKDDTLLSQPFKEVKCMLLSPCYTLVPTHLVDENSISSYLMHILPLPKNDMEFFSYRLNEKGITAVFALPRVLTAIVRDFAPHATFYNQCIPQINKQLAEQTGSKAQLTLFVSHDLACFSLIKESQLVVNTSFTFESSSDLIYYTMLILKENGVKPTDVEVYISGKVEKQSAQYAELSQFLPNLAFDSVPKGFEYSYLFKFRAEHQFANLFKLTECE